MKSITEFTQPILQKVLAAKTTLISEGKTPEEISAALGETFKLEGDKLKHVQVSADLVAGKPTVRRVLVATFNEGETIPSKYQKVEETYYAVESLELNKPAAVVAPTKGGRGGGRSGGNRSGGGPKGSPWGESADDIAAKKKAMRAAAQAKKA